MWRPYRSVPSNTAWCVWTAPVRWSEMPCCGTTLDREAADDLVVELGGADEYGQADGVVPVAAITAAKLRWLADHEPDHADATAAVCLPHDWLTWRLSGSTDIGDLRAPTTAMRAEPGTSRRKPTAISPTCSSWHCRGRRPAVPMVLGPRDAAGQMGAGVRLGPGAGDNAAAALGLGAGPGDCVVSLGTSGVVSAVGQAAPHDPEGIVAGFAEPRARRLPLVCTLNGAGAGGCRGGVGVDFEELDRLALSAPAGAEGLTIVPYFDGERSPNLPHAAGAFHGVTTRNLTSANVARAAVEGLLSSIAYCIDKIAAQGVDAERIILVGGACSEAVRHIAPAIWGTPVHVPPAAEYVALGAARQAAWTLSQQDSPPPWSFGVTPSCTAEPTPQVYEQYRAAQPLTLGQ